MLYADIWIKENCGGADRGHVVSPVLNLHEGALQALHEAFGPTDGPVAVIIYEADPGTTLADLNGTGFNTTGDWLTGVTHPIINESPITCR